MNVDDIESVSARLFSSIRALSEDGDGVTRPSYSEVETAAHGVIAREAHDLGLEVSCDPAANLVVSLRGEMPEGSEGSEVWCGSHLDSVPCGGNYDGAAGVIAGLLALAAMRGSGRRFRQTVKLVAFRGEESAWFGKGYLGASALFGKIHSSDLFRERHGSEVTLRQAMASVDVDLDMVEHGWSLIDPRRICAFLELHIEQGPRLEAENVPIGVVTGIRGIRRHASIVCHGEDGHAGTVPMASRRDPVFATSDFLSEVSAGCRSLVIAGVDLVVTSGVLGTDPRVHAATKIPGEVVFSLEWRSSSEGIIRSVEGLIYHAARSAEDLHGVKFDFDTPTGIKPVMMNQGLVALLRETVEEMSIPYRDILSGAGHDAAIFSAHGIPTGMIFVRNQHGSHNPREAMRLDDFAAGVRVLTSALESLADEPAP